MKILLTGAFGNLGASSLELLLKEGGHEVRCFDVKNPRNEKVMEKLSGLGKFETVWGDICDAAVCEKIVNGMDCILHLAAIIPPISEMKPEVTRKVNIGGTKNLIEAAKKSGKNPKFVFTSSVTVHGVKHAVPPPRRADEPMEPTDTYTSTKVESELELREKSGLNWTVLRIGAALPLDMLDRDMKSSLATSFAIPLEQRVEFVHPMDVATAVANSVTASTEGKILYLGGGRNCQMTNRDFQAKLLDTMGIGMLPDDAFRIPKDDSDFWYTDYMDTGESQKLLKFQNHSFDMYLSQLKKEFGWRGVFTRMFKPAARWWMVGCSPFYNENKTRKM